MTSSDEEVSEPPRFQLDEEEHWIRLVPYGTSDGPEMAAFMDRVKHYSAGRPYFQMLVDLREGSGASPEARRIAAEAMREMPPRDIAFFGGSFANRMLANLILRAIELLGSAPMKHVFAATEEEAVHWLNERRDARQGSAQ